MADIGHFNADDVDTEVGFDPVPPGTYTMIVSNSDLRTVKNKPGEQYLWIEHTIVDGPFKGRKLFNNFNLWNPAAKRMAEAHFGCLCKAAGKRQVKDSLELHNIPFQAEVDIDKTNPQYNRIKEYFFEGKDKKAAEKTATAQVAAGPVPWGNG